MLERTEEVAQTASADDPSAKQPNSFERLASSSTANFKGFRVSYLFIWALDLWQYLIVRREVVGHDFVDVHVLYWTIAGVFCFCAMAFHLKRTPDSSSVQDRSYDFIAALAMVVGTVLLCISFPFSNTATTIAGVSLSAVGGAYALLRWLQFYSSLPVKTAMSYLIVAYVFYFAVLPFVNMVPQALSVALIITLPIVSTYMLRQSTEHRPPCSSGSIYYTRENIQGFWKIGLGIVLYSFLLGVRRGFALSKADPAMDFLCFALGILFLALLYWWIFGTEKAFDFPRLLQVLLIVLATGAMLLPIFPNLSKEVISGFFSAASSIILVLLFMAFVDLSNHSSYHPFVICGIGIGLYGIPRPLGALAADYLKVFPSEQYAAMLALLIAYLIIICTAFLLSTRPAGLRPLFYDLTNHTADPNGFETVDVRCQSLGERHGLSQREIEVIQLICKGRDKAYIAETLFIAENTVRSYSKNAYRKLDVHSKRELLDLVESEHAT